jgi:DNA-binding LacI/PurR family transcriptional regulator
MVKARTTSADVARLAGVSRATVSYVLNGRDQSIAEATKQRVFDAVRELDYVPNAASRALRGGTSHLVLLVNTSIPWSTNVSDLEDHLTSLVAGSGRSLVVWRRQGPEDLSATLANLEPCVVISQDLLTAPERELLARVGIPLVEVDIASPGTDLPTRLQVEHLQAYGHERIGYLTTSEPALQRFAAPRLSAFRAACAALGLPEPVVGTVPGGLSVTADDVAQHLSAWTSDDDPVTAVACFNDFHAAVCLAAAQQVGLWVPYDLAVIGLDDDIFAPITSPPLTTIRLDNRRFAEHLWASARHHLRDGPEPKPFDPSARLVERSSVRPVYPERTSND